MCPCWPASLLDYSPLLFSSTILTCVSPQVEGMDVYQDVNSMDVDDPSLNPSDEGSNTFHIQVRSSMGNSRSVTCECELPLLLPQLQCANFKITVLSKVSPDPSCKNGARALPSCILETWKWCERGSLSSVGILTLGIGEWVHVTPRRSIYHSIHRTISGAWRAHLNARYGARPHPLLTSFQQRLTMAKASKWHANKIKCSAGYVMHSFTIIFFLSFDPSSLQARKIVESCPYVPMAAQKLVTEKSFAKKMLHVLFSQLTFISNLLQAGGGWWPGATGKPQAHQCMHQRTQSPPLSHEHWHSQWLHCHSLDGHPSIHPSLAVWESHSPKWTVSTMPCSHLSFTNLYFGCSLQLSSNMHNQTGWWYWAHIYGGRHWLSTTNQLCWWRCWPQ